MNATPTTPTDDEPDDFEVFRAKEQPIAQKWVILASHAKRDEIRFVPKGDGPDVLTFPSMVDARVLIGFIKRQQAAGLNTRWAGFNLYPQRLNADRLV